MTETDTLSRAIGLYQKASDLAGHLRENLDEAGLSIVAGESITLFGCRAEVTVAWPDGLPMGFTDEAALRDFCAQWLSESRARRQNR
jgi:hypothetical protein